MAKHVLSVDQSTQGTKAMVFDENGKMLAKQHVKGDIIDHDGDYLLTWEEKWDTVNLNGKPFPKRWYGIIRGYQLFDK